MMVMLMVEKMRLKRNIFLSISCRSSNWMKHTIVIMSLELFCKYIKVCFKNSAFIENNNDDAWRTD